MKVVGKTCAERRKITLLKDVKMRNLFEERVTELVDVGEPNLCLKYGVLKVCGKKMGRRSRGDTWWTEEVNEAVSRKIDAQLAMCQSSTEENKSRYKSMKNKVMKAVSKAMREKAEEALTEFYEIAHIGCLS